MCAHGPPSLSTSGVLRKSKGDTMTAEADQAGRDRRKLPGNREDCEPPPTAPAAGGPKKGRRLHSLEQKRAGHFASNCKQIRPSPSTLVRPTPGPSTGLSGRDLGKWGTGQSPGAALSVSKRSGLSLVVPASLLQGARVTWRRRLNRATQPAKRDPGASSPARKRCSMA